MTKDKIILDMLIKHEKQIQQRYDKAINTTEYSDDAIKAIETQLRMARAIVKAVKGIVED
jgi:hypothetical protein